jgi:hypothetical protein
VQDVVPLELLALSVQIIELADGHDVEPTLKGDLFHHLEVRVARKGGEDEHLRRVRHVRHDTHDFRVRPVHGEPKFFDGRGGR